jgi:hypothetical protein
MSRLIPTQNTWVAFCSSMGNIASPDKSAELDGATNLTPFLVSLNASTRGNVVATPSFDTKFETSIDGTVTATFEADFYRDSSADTAWTTLARGTNGYIVIARFGRSGATPNAGDTVEVWPVRVTSRAAANLTNNTAQTFTVTCAIPSVPNEAATVVA